MKLEIFHVDAFAEQIFQGNPAAVCLLDQWLPSEIMQGIASELNLSETAFCVQRSDTDYRIRWFTPTIEVKLCGHATLAAAHILYSQKLHSADSELSFQSLGGQLVARQVHGGLSLTLPAQKAAAIDKRDDIQSVLNANIKELYAGEDLVAILSDASEVEIYEPNFNAISTLPYRGVCITAPGNGNGFDFVCRFFAPQSGINEDPVTGSSFAMLAPIYALKLRKTAFRARQVSSRGGNVTLSLSDNRVTLVGNAITVMQSTFQLPSLVR